MPALLARLSKNERKLFSLIPRDGTKLTSKELISKFYNGKGPPDNARVIVMGMIRIVQRKLYKHDAPCILCASERAGPIPIQIWLEPRTATVMLEAEGAA